MIPKNSFFEQTSEQVKGISSDKFSESEHKSEEGFNTSLNWRQLLDKIHKIINGPQLKKKKSVKSNFSQNSQKNENQTQFKCTCRKTKCLKLYCQCLAKGSYCKDCNCEDCFNIPQQDAIRSITIDQILQKNPDAFDNESKIKNGKGGCICKKTGCLKKYCQCYSLGRECSSQCKCMNCENKLKIV